MAEVEAHTLGSNLGALLSNVLSQFAAQGRVQDMGCRVVGADGITARDIDREDHFVIDAQCTAYNGTDMSMEIAEPLLCITHNDANFSRHDDTCIADLAARLCVIRGLIDDNGYF
jgi:hypothetical protein